METAARKKLVELGDRSQEKVCGVWKQQPGPGGGGQQVWSKERVEEAASDQEE